MGATCGKPAAGGKPAEDAVDAAVLKDLSEKTAAAQALTEKIAARAVKSTEKAQQKSSGEKSARSMRLAPGAPPNVGAYTSSYLAGKIEDAIGSDTGYSLKFESQEHKGAVLFVEIEGLSRLLDRVSSSAGAVDLDVISAELDEFVGGIMSCVQDFEGDVLYSVGDSLVGVWMDRHNKAALQLLAMRAIKCAFEIREKFTCIASIDIVVRMALSAGDLKAITVGEGPDWDFVLMGTLFNDLRAIVRTRKPAEVVVTDQGWRYVSTFAEGVQLENGWLLHHVEDTRGLVSRVNSAARAPPPEQLGPLLVPFIPKVVRAVLEKEIEDLIACVSLAAVHVGQIYIKQSTGKLIVNEAQVQHIHRQVLAAAQKHDGCLVKAYPVDDGAVFLAGFGVPGTATPQMAERCLRFAFEVRGALEGMRRISAEIAVTTGPLFGGLVGNAVRQEYIFLGAPIHFGEQLLAAAQAVAGNSVVCDIGTRRAVGGAFDFAHIPAVRVDGYEFPIELYKPSPLEQEEEDEWRELQRTTPPLRAVGMKDLLNDLLAAVDDCAGFAMGAAVLLTGGPSSGKTTLRETFARAARGMGVLVCECLADEAYRNVPFFLSSALAAAFDCKPGEVEGRIRALVESDPGIPRELADVAALLAPIFGGTALNAAALAMALERVEAATPMTRATAGGAGTGKGDSVKKGDWSTQDVSAAAKAGEGAARGRVEAVSELAAYVLERLAEASNALVLVIDDAHWLDRASWWLLEAIAARGSRRCLVVAFARPQSPGDPPELTAWRSDETVARSTLPVLKASHVVAMANPYRLPQPLAIRIADAAKGNPAEAEAILEFLRDKNSLPGAPDKSAPKGKGKGKGRGSNPNPNPNPGITGVLLATMTPASATDYNASVSGPPSFSSNNVDGGSARGGLSPNQGTPAGGATPKNGASLQVPTSRKAILTAAQAAAEAAAQAAVASAMGLVDEFDMSVHLRAKVERLTGDAKSLLCAAALVGYTFGSWDVASCSDLPPDAVEVALRALIDAGLVRRTGPFAYRFRSRRILDTALVTVAADAGEAARRVAEHFERVTPAGAPSPAELARLARLFEQAAASAPGGTDSAPAARKARRYAQEARAAAQRWALVDDLAALGRREEVQAGKKAVRRARASTLHFSGSFSGATPQDAAAAIAANRLKLAKSRIYV